MSSASSRVFSPDSMIWKICRERVTLLHGPAAAVLQVAHPRIALGVMQHSNFRVAPTARLNRTLDAVYTMVFGTRAQAVRAAASVARIHAKVRGDASAHDVPGAAEYAADEADLLMWVIATMIIAAIDGYERSVSRLGDLEKDLFYGDMRLLGTFFGLDRRYGPQTWREFERYWQEQINDARLGAHPVSRAMAWSVASPGQPIWLGACSLPIRFIFSEILPQPASRRLGFRSSPYSRLSLLLTTRALKVFTRCAPGFLRYVPHYNRAMRDLQSTTGDLAIA